MTCEFWGLDYSDEEQNGDAWLVGLTCALPSFSRQTINCGSNTLPILERAFVDERRESISHPSITELPDELLKLAFYLAIDWRFKAATRTPRMGSSGTTGSKQRT